MATVGNQFLTLLDLRARMTNGEVQGDIIDILAQTNELLGYLPFIEANDGTTNKATIRTGIPEGTWRMLNYGVKQKKSTTAQVRDASGMLENYSTVDKALADMSGDKAGFLLSESKAFIEGMNQQAMRTFLYGNGAVEAQKFTGLAPRYSQLTSAENAQNIIDAGGTGSDNTSIWLLVLSPETITGFYPKGSKAGLQQRDLGEQTVYDAENNPYQAYRSHYKWDMGLSVRDWRYAVRIANIDLSDLTKNASGGADLIDLMTQALELVQDLNNGRAVFVVNRQVRGFLRRQMANKANVQLAMEEVAGKKVMTFGEVPVVRVDALLNTEARVV